MYDMGLFKIDALDVRMPDYDEVMALLKSVECRISSSVFPQVQSTSCSCK